ncbi:hypothetical protein Tco_0794108 [Tanacetum coccineum]
MITSLFVTSSPKRKTKKGEVIVRDTLKMELTEMKLDFKKCDTILSENFICLTGNKDHPQCLPRPHALISLPYGMLLTRLHRHVLTIHPYPLTDAHLLTPHVMVPLTEGWVKRFLVDGKRPHPPTPTPSTSSSSQSPSQSQEQINPVDKYTLDPSEYCNQLPPIPGASEEYKQIKGMFKCLGYFLSNFGKKKK